MTTWWRTPFAARVVLLAALVAAAIPVRAAIVSYEWVPQAGSGGSGFLTLNSVLISDPANFSGVTFAGLTALNYTFGSGAHIQKGDIQFFQGFPFSAAAGQLTNGFQFSTNTAALSFSLASNAGVSSNQIQTPAPASTDAGNWRLAAPAAVPLPATVWLFASGFMGLIGVARRRHRSPSQSN
jgi:hypothetical protein